MSNKNVCNLCRHKEKASFSLESIPRSTPIDIISRNKLCINEELLRQDVPHKPSFQIGKYIPKSTFFNNI